MIITIGGTPGAGKDSVGTLLSKKLDYKKYSIGDMRRQLAEEHGITLEELNSLGESESWTDNDVDDFQEELGATMDNIIVISRLGFHFIPGGFKIFLKCDLGIGAERIYNDRSGKYRDVEKYASQEEVLEHLEKRQLSDAQRYKKYYGLKIDELEHYDFIIDTSRLSVDDATEIILCAARKMESQGIEKEKQ